MHVIGIQQRGFGSRSYNNLLFRRPIRFEICFILLLLEARSVIRTATDRKCDKSKVRVSAYADEARLESELDLLC